MKLFFRVLIAVLFIGFSAHGTAPHRDPYKINFKALESRIFFLKSPGEKEALFRRTNFITDLPRGSFNAVSTPLNEAVTANAKKKGAKTVLASLRWSALLQKKAANKEGLKACYGKVNNINDVMISLLLESDSILVNKALDLKKVRRLLMEDHSKKVIPYNGQLDLSKPGEALFNRKSVVKRTPGTKLRFLSFNILASLWNHRPQVPPRAGEVIKFLKETAPDAAGLQEIDKEWIKALKGRIAPYKFVTVKTIPPGKTVMGNIIYDSSRYREVTGGHHPFYSNRNSLLRCFYWVMLEDLKTKKRFIFANTHWDLNVPLRIQNAEKMSGFVLELRKKYDLPIICTGDYNSNVDSRELQLFLQKSGLADAVSTASYTENRDLASYYSPKYFTAPPWKEKKHIDHIIATKDLVPLSARLVLDKKLLLSSDHLPLIVDYK